MQNKQKDVSRFIIRDRGIAAIFDTMQHHINCAVRLYDNQEYESALQAYLLAIDCAKKAVKSAERKGKRAYIGKFNGYILSMSFDVGKCHSHLKQFQACLPYFEFARANGMRNAISEMAIAYFNMGQYDHAMRCVDQDKLYQSFDPIAIYDLAACLRIGQNGVQKDLNKALRYFLSLYQRGFRVNQMDATRPVGEVAETIAQLYAELKNPQKEFEWHHKALEEGEDVHALFNLGVMYRDGEATKKNGVKALEYFSRSLDLGHDDAANEIALIYQRGLAGVDADRAKAEAFFTLGVEQFKSPVAASNFVAFLCEHDQRDLTRRPQIERCLKLAEKANRFEAMSARATLLYQDCLVSGESFEEAVDIFQELALQGVASAQTNLAVIHQNHAEYNTAVAVYWYLEAIKSSKDERPRDNLLVLMRDLTKEMRDRPDELMALFDQIIVQYRQTLPKSKRKPGKDVHLDLYQQLADLARDGLSGQFDERFKHVFPDLSLAIHRDLAPINERITDVARDGSQGTSEKIQFLLEYALAASRSTRNLTCAMRRIGEIVKSSRRGHDMLIENEALFFQLVERLQHSTLDHEGFMELCVGVSKLGLHPVSRLIAPCYDILSRYLSQKQHWEDFPVSPYQVSMLLGALSDMPAEFVLVPLVITRFSHQLIKNIEQLNQWQLFKTLQALCVLHAGLADDQVLFKKLFASMIDVCLVLSVNFNPSEQSPIDLYQLYLCLSYAAQCGHAVEMPRCKEHYKMAFIGMLGWLQNRSSVSPSRGQREVAQCLSSMGFDVKEETCIKGLFVDVFLKNEQIVVEFDGPLHFLQAHPDEQLPELRRARDVFHEKILGLPVIRIRYRDWDQLRSIDEKRQFMQEKLSGVVDFDLPEKGLSLH